MAFPLRINGSIRSVDVDGETPLPWIVRDVLGNTDTKFGYNAQTGSPDKIAINEMRSL
jgi:aerobic-type carbon monoxide dehydrogenase small subunit (CoxS/CutS family)